MLDSQLFKAESELHSIAEISLASVPGIIAREGDHECCWSGG